MIKISVYRRDDQGLIEHMGVQEWDSVRQLTQHFLVDDEQAVVEEMRGWPDASVAWQGNLGYAIRPSGPVVEFIEREQIWQDETTRYWFRVDGENYAVAESGPETSILGQDGDEILDRVLEAHLRQLLVVTDEMRTA